MRKAINLRERFPLKVVTDLARVIERLYSAISLCDKPFPVVEGLSNFPGYLCDTSIISSKFAATLRFFKPGEYNFVIIFPWVNFNIKTKKLVFSGRVEILMSRGSKRSMCRKIVGEITEKFFRYHCMHPSRKVYAGEIPSKIFSYKGRIPWWYAQVRAWLTRHNFSDPVACWLAAKEWFLSQGFVFWGSEAPPRRKSFTMNFIGDFFCCLA